MADKLPPLPKGAVFVEDELPPLPKGATFVPSDRSVPVPMSDEEQAIAEKKWRDYQNSFSHKAGEFAEEGLRMLEGLPMLGPEVKIGEGAIPYVINQIPALEQGVSTVARHMPDITKVTAHPLYKKAMGAVEPVAEKVADVASKAWEKTKGIPSAILGRTAGLTRNPEDKKNALNIAYQIAKESDPELEKILKEGANIPIVNRQVYNYARSHALPSDYAAIAYDTTRGKRPDLMGSWDLYDKLLEEGLAKGKKIYEIFPTYQDYSKLKLPQKMELAKAAGIDLGTWLPQGKVAKALVEGEAGLGGLGGLGLLHNIPSALKSLANWKLIPAMFLQSPKIVGKLAYGAGKARRYGPDILRGIKNVPTPALVGGLNYLRGNEED